MIQFTYRCYSLCWSNVISYLHPIISKILRKFLVCNLFLPFAETIKTCNQPPNELSKKMNVLTISHDWIFFHKVSIFQCFYMIDSKYLPARSSAIKEFEINKQANIKYLFIYQRNFLTFQRFQHCVQHSGRSLLNFFIVFDSESLFFHL